MAIKILISGCNFDDNLINIDGKCKSSVVREPNFFSNFRVIKIKKRLSLSGTKVL
ncbi:hypothetical protein HanIR_Chr10g0461631 [Helianthus annuus]|nr:hypothetical protein HanIR_Chr10g0461631 [Helianthus annuus]